MLLTEALIKIIPLLWMTCRFKLSVRKIEILLSLSKAATLYHPNIISFIIPLPGRASKAWEPPNKAMLFLSFLLDIIQFLPMRYLC
jgi:hypothetical protein